MDKEVNTILKLIKAKKYSPIYLLTGEESYYIDKVSDYIENNVLTEAEKGFNLIVLYGKDVECNTIVQNARRFPMMADYQVVIVKEAQEISDFNREAGQKLMLQYVQNPTPTTILVLDYKYKKLDARKTVTKAIAKAGVILNTKKIWDNQLIPWIDNYVKSTGFNINQKGKILLAESIGANLSRMSNEITKVTINLKEGEEITEDLIQKYIGISKDYNVFELQKWLSHKNASRVYNIINYFGENPKNHPIIPILANLFAYFSKLLLAYEYKVRSENDAKTKLGLNFFNAKDFLVAIRNYNYKKAQEIIAAIEIADLQSKGIEYQNMNEKEILKELVYRIMH